ncbi:MAG: chemotaxis protein CheA, partial [Hyphomicrobiales bacterium]
MDDLLTEFLTETGENLDVVDVELVRLEQNPNNAAVLDNIFRLVHTIKGTCGFLGLPRLEALAHAAETLMGKFRDGVSVTPDAVTVILESLDRIKGILAALEQTQAEPEGSDHDLIGRLDHLSAASGDPVSAVEPAYQDHQGFRMIERPLRPGEVSLEELERAFQEAEGPSAATPQGADAGVSDPAGEEAVAGEQHESAVKNQSIRVNVDTLETLMTRVSELVLTRNQLLEMVRHIQDSEFKVPLQRLSNVTAELQEGVMKTRMQPVGNAWQKLPRIVRGLANDLGKKIDLEMHGAETELDRQVLELIKDPLTHMVRNSADHGLETTEQRRAADKPETGRITLSAYHEGGHIIIEIADDGHGLDVDRIRQTALDNGLVTPGELDGLSDAQIHRFIFKAGFSTAREITSVSGRGIGMDVVRANIEQIGGSVGVSSVAGRGTTFSIKIPLTLAIVSALIVETGGQRFAVPQISVVELVRARTDSGHCIETIDNAPVLRLRNKLLPLIHLSSLLGLDTGTSAPDAEAIG